MNLISDKDGVDVIIAPVTGKDGVEVNIDFNFPEKHLYDLDHRVRDWDLKLMDGRKHIGTATFTAYQFLADGVYRRTIALKNLTIKPRARNQGKSYDLMKFVLDTVKRECDREWGEAYGDAVVFIEKKDMAHVEEKDRAGLFDFLKKIAEKIIGGGAFQPSDSDLAVSVIGDQISMQLIKGHLLRSYSVKAENGNPRKDR